MSEEIRTNNEDGQVVVDNQSVASSIMPVIDTGVQEGDKVHKIAPLNCRLAFTNYTEGEQKEIMALSNAINVAEISKVMNYGAEPAEKTFSQCGNFLKKEKGSSADQDVISQVIKLSKEAGQAKEDFDLVLKEPNFLQKLVLAITTGGKDNYASRVQKAAVTNYDLVFSLSGYCKQWMETLQRAYNDINEAGLSDLASAVLVEKYIIAGEFAMERIEKEINDAKAKYDETGQQAHLATYKELSQGYKIFLQKMKVLKDARDAYEISIGQLALIKETNTNIQVAVTTQTQQTMTVMAQQLRNAVLDAKNKEVMEAQKALRTLNSKLIEKISKSIGVRAEDAEKLLGAGIYDVESAKKAVTTLINAYDEIKKIGEENYQKLKAGNDELGGLLEQLSQRMDPMSNTEAIETNAQSALSGASSRTSSYSGGELKF